MIPFKSPCTPDCEKRTANCRTTCISHKVYEYYKHKEYGKRIAKVEEVDYFKRKSENIKNKYIKKKERIH